MGNPKKQSRFICLKHCGENHILDGLQRGGHQREKKHIKDAFCIICQETVKNLEVRYCDNYQEIIIIIAKSNIIIFHGLEVYDNGLVIFS